MINHAPKTNYDGSYFLWSKIDKKWGGELFSCYSDFYLQKYLDDHNCETLFTFKNEREMLHCIKEWEKAWNENRYFRWIIQSKKSKKIAGTIEIASIPNTENYVKDVLAKPIGSFIENPTHLFEQNVQNGVLRIDIISDFAKENLFNNLLITVKKHFFTEYNLKNIIVQCFASDSERYRAVRKNNFHQLNFNGCQLENYFIQTDY
ncbi:hypothetical protein J9303_08100 [Bacillaceae bacterium Marseille-Q3522]|nr:hypothetical protein [Bacillaceae bacterium Marseille-Q3522]